MVDDLLCPLFIMRVLYLLVVIIIRSWLGGYFFPIYWSIILDIGLKIAMKKLKIKSNVQTLLRKDLQIFVGIDWDRFKKENCSVVTFW
jgi:hypothetical protein